MVRMPIKTVAASVALALAMVLLTVPLGGTVQAATPMHGAMMHDAGGSALFEPNELPDPFERDFGSRCKWWRYDLKNGHYVRTFCLCRYGDQEVDYRKNVRGAWQEMLNGGSTAKVVSVDEGNTVSVVMAQPEAAAASGTAALPNAPVASGTATMPEAEPAAGTAALPEPPTKVEEAATSIVVRADLADTLVEANDYLALLIATGAAGLTDLLHGEGPYTLFAPDDAAFAALPPGRLEELLAEPSGDLARIVEYHVVPGIVTAADMSDGEKLQTLEGSTITVTIDGDTIFVNDAKVVEPDITAANGVIHVIDAVLQLPAEQ